MPKISRSSPYSALPILVCQGTQHAPWSRSCRRSSGWYLGASVTSRNPILSRERNGRRQSAACLRLTRGNCYGRSISGRYATPPLGTHGPAHPQTDLLKGKPSKSPSTLNIFRFDGRVVEEPLESRTFQSPAWRRRRMVGSFGSTPRCAPIPFANGPDN